MSKTIQHKRSSVAGNQPNQDQVAVGELAINFADRSIYTKDGSNVITELARDIWRTDTQPDSAQEGDFWYNTSSGELSFWDGTNWENPSFGGGSPDPDSATVEGGFVEGSGTSSDPYVVETVYGNIGDTGVHVATVSVPGLNPAQIVPLQDLNASENGGRFTADNQMAGLDGVLTVNISFDDNPPTSTATTYSGELKIGSNSIYINSDVVMAEALEGGTDIDVPTGPSPSGPFTWQGADNRTLTATYPLLISKDGGYFTDQIEVSRGDQIWIKWAGDPGSGVGIDEPHGTTISGAVTDGVGGAKFFYFTIDKETSFVFQNFVDSDQTVGGLSESRVATVTDVNSYVYPFGSTTGDSAQYAVNGGDWTDMPETNTGSATDYMVEGDEFQLRHRDAATNNTASTYTFNMAGDSADWTTVTADVTPTVKQPEIESPATDDATGIGTSGPFVSSDFEMAEGVDTHTASSWQLKPLAWQSGNLNNGGTAVYDGAASDGTQFCVVDYSGAAYTSPDGITWTNRGATGFTKGYGLIWDGSQFVGVGEGAATSPDGITWTYRSTHKSNNSGSAKCYGIAYGNGIYLSYHNGGRIMRSTDSGVTWRAYEGFATATSGKSINGIGYSDELSLFVAAGSGVLATSSDGIEWTVQPNFEGSGHKVAWNGKLFAVCSVASGTGVFTSPDAVNWTHQPMDGVQVRQCQNIVADGDTFILDNDGQILTSTDGVDWQDAGNNTGLGAAKGLAVSSDRWLAAHQKGTASYSKADEIILDSDGSALTSWTPSTELDYKKDYKIRVRHHTATLNSEWSDYRSFETKDLPASQWNGITNLEAQLGFTWNAYDVQCDPRYKNFISISSPGKNLIISQDGINWERVDATFSQSIYSISPDGAGKWIAGGKRGRYWYSSTAGTGWTESLDIANINGSEDLVVAAKGTSKLIFVTNTGRIWTSTSRSGPWSQTAFNVGSKPSGGIATSPTHSIMANINEVHISTNNFNTKTTVSSIIPTNNSVFRSIAYGDGKFVVITSYGEIAVSSDNGSTWDTSRLDALHLVSKEQLGSSTYVQFPSYTSGFLRYIEGQGIWVCVGYDNGGGNDQKQLLFVSSDAINWKIQESHHVNYPKSTESADTVATIDGNENVIVSMGQQATLAHTID